MQEQTKQQAQTLSQAQKLFMAGDVQGADQLVRGLLAHLPDHIESLYLKAVIDRYRKDISGAKDAISRLLTLSPSFGRAYQELGFIHSSSGDTANAIAAFEQALHANPGLIGAWQALIPLHSQRGDRHKAAAAKAQFDRLKALPQELLTVTNFLYEDKILKAEKLCRAFLKVNPTHVEGMRLLAEIAGRFGILDEAEFLLKCALDIAPDHIPLKLDLITTLRKAQKYEEALTLATALRDSAPNNPVFLSYYAIQAMQAGDYQAALKGFDQVLDHMPNDPATHTSKGHALKTLGRQEEAIDCYHTALQSAPWYGDAWYGLANLKTYRFDKEALTRMQQQLDTAAAPLAAQIYIHFALGKGFEDHQDYDQAFHHYQAGNALKLKDCRYDPDQMQQEFDLMARVVTPDLLTKHQKAGSGCTAPDPIFIVGLPRAGSTLIEQILASHSMVDGTMELPNIIMLTKELRQQKPLEAPDGYPLSLADISPDQLTKLGERYLAETRQHRGNAPFFTDKMPNNFRHIGLIKLMLPNAKIIDARRGAVACCFSGFKQLFAEGQEFSYSLDHLGRYYKGYVALMDHFDQVMPGAIHRINYEEMIHNSETEIRKLLDYCGLPFEQACLDFHATQRPVKTASSEQVREKINTKGLDAWKPFERHLAPLQKALSD